MLQPVQPLGVRSKVVVVHLNGLTGFPKRRSDDLATEETGSVTPYSTMILGLKSTSVAS
ncbi:MAG TPA: hypothetical protein VMR20_16080 [Verrucomicrobiae bacterium]|nr:hypothetical protein [Verrucomicrobiae bacterium]